MAGAPPIAPAECAALANDVAAGRLTVRIVNETSGVIVLGQKDVNCVTEPVFRVHDESGKELTAPDRQCTDCAAIAAVGYSGCNSSCPQPLAIALATGESLDAAWEGLYSKAEEYPSACSDASVPVVNGKPTCWRSARAAPGTYVFSATAGTSIDCSAAAGGACQPCQPREGGGCATQQGTVTDLGLVAKAEVTIGSGSGDEQAEAVELVFTD